MKLFYALPLSARRTGTWRPKNKSPMANSTKANAGAAQLAAGNKAKKPKADKKPPEHPEVLQDIQAPYKFTPEEQAAMNAELRLRLNEVDELTDQKKASMQDFTLRITNKSNDVKALRNKLDSGEETRAFKAIVEFDVPRSMKRFLHPTTREFIREEAMTPADWQLPMFKPADDGSETVAPKGATDVPTGQPAAPAKKSRRKATPEGDPNANAGLTPVGAVITQTAAATTPPKVTLDLTAEWTHSGLLKAWREAASKAGWHETQISVISQQLKLIGLPEKMVDTLRPHCVVPPPPPEKPPFD